ncbi:unnamed protein product [Ectocarpus sp. 6 AP-2014]
MAFKRSNAATSSGEFLTHQTTEARKRDRCSRENQQGVAGESSVAGVTRNSPLNDARTESPFQNRHAVHGNFAKIKAGMLDDDHSACFSRSFGHGSGAARGNGPAAGRTRASANRENNKQAPRRKNSSGGWHIDFLSLERPPGEVCH